MSPVALELSFSEMRVSSHLCVSLNGFKSLMIKPKY